MPENQYLVITGIDRNHSPMSLPDMFPVTKAGLSKLCQANRHKVKLNCMSVCLLPSMSITELFIVSLLFAITSDLSFGTDGHS